MGNLAKNQKYEVIAEFTHLDETGYIIELNNKVLILKGRCVWALTIDRLKKHTDLRPSIATSEKIWAEYFIMLEEFKKEWRQNEQ